MSVLIFVQSRGNTLGVGASTFGIGNVRLQTELSCLKPRSPLKLESPNFSYGRVCQIGVTIIGAGVKIPPKGALRVVFENGEICPMVFIDKKGFIIDPKLSSQWEHKQHHKHHQRPKRPLVCPKRLPTPCLQIQWQSLILESKGVFYSKKRIKGLVRVGVKYVYCI